MDPQDMGEQEEEEEQLIGYIEVMVQCPFCGAYVPDDFECLRCGVEMFESFEEGSLKYVCSECGEEVEDTAEECSSCGAVLE